ncbi:MAG: sel1 repeat family protein [Desulfobacteraceae bacterium]|nr:sel1 repeat family protein [Desulfobacteraceae bacterium]
MFRLLFIPILIFFLLTSTEIHAQETLPTKTYKGIELSAITPNDTSIFDVDIISGDKAILKIRAAIDLIYQKSPANAQAINSLKTKGTVIIIYDPRYPHKSHDLVGVKVAYFLPFYFDNPLAWDRLPLPVVISRHGIKWPLEELASVIIHELAGHGVQYTKGQTNTVRGRELECNAWLYEELAHQHFGLDKFSKKMIEFRQQLGGVGFYDGHCSDFIRYIREKIPVKIGLWEQLNPDVAGLLELLDKYIKYLSDSGITKDSLLAKEKYLEETLARVDEYGTPLEQFSLGIALFEGAGVKQDPKTGLKLMQKSAIRGFAEAQYVLAKIYDSGETLKQNFLFAFRLIKSAANQGFAPAQKIQPAIYRHAADAGISQAQFALGSMYEKGAGVKKDIVGAVSFYKKAANQGNKHAQYALARLFSTGIGVDKNLTKSAEWCLKSADQGFIPALATMAFLYKKGYGVKQNFSDAAKWYRKAAEQNDPNAQYYLAKLYSDGKGLDKDKKQAYFWLCLADKNSDKKFKKPIKKLKNQVMGFLTKEELAEISNEAQNWKPTEKPRI